MSNLSVPERKQEAFFLKINNLLNRSELDNHSEALANILMANYQILNGEALRAREYLSIAEPLMKSVNDSRLKNQYTYVNIFVLRSEGDLVKALDDAEELYNEVKDKWGLNKLGDLVLEQAYISSLLSMYQETIPLLELALDYSLEANDPYLISETYNVFGILYSFLNDTQSSIMYFKKAVEVMERHPALVSNIYFYANLADSYGMNKEYDKALELIEKARVLAIQEGDVPLQAFAHQVKARVYTNTEDYRDAISELVKAKELQEQVGEQLFGYELHIDFAYAYLKLDEIDEAESHLDKAIISAEKVAALDDFYLKRLRSEISAARENYKSAYELLQESYETYRKTFNDNLTYVSNLSREQLDQERLSFENKLLEKENQINTKYVKKYKKYNIILFTLIILLLILIGIGIWLVIKYRIAARKNEEMALTDNLTELPNRRQMFRQLDSEHQKSEGGRSVYSLIIFDIDHFKTINDRFGHRMGDKVISRLAAITRNTLREDDTIGRISGEEFLVILPNTKVQEAVQIADRLNKQFADADFRDLDEGIHLTASFGVTEYMPDDESLDMVINRADRLLYKAKNEGRNRVVSTFNDEPDED
ncbi:tetratricopeptide repeat-containing diguanylate cyclase [Kangiella sediminilitoris]|nr:tetratricopeptide repeat-containing diguanylate cyclase [Kangiella sediminilitoris]